ncbi:MAG: hypothetical protein KatS3mg103_1440 [Phycisphaerales bacterium]|nr:MAG: hypothetical protein KatS3mg103_1440 [Phycisphaerales bacterium]
MNDWHEPAAALIDAFRAVAQANHDLRDLADAQRRAISAMDARSLEAINHRQRQAGARLADAEALRRQHAQRLCHALGLPDVATLPDLARALGAHDPALGRSLAQAAEDARRAILDCQSKQRVVHAAATGVLLHLDGLARQLLARLNTAGLYAPSGALAGNARAAGVDVVS